MSARELRDRITIQRPQLSPNGQGGQLVSWVDLIANLWAKVEPSTTQNEALLGDKVTGVQAYRLELYRRADVDIGMRMLWTPRWPAGAVQKTLEIVAGPIVVRDPAKHAFICLETA